MTIRNMKMCKSMHVCIYIYIYKFQFQFDRAPTDSEHGGSVMEVWTLTRSWAYNSKQLDIMHTNFSRVVLWNMSEWNFKEWVIFVQKLTSLSHAILSVENVWHHVEHKNMPAPTSLLQDRRPDPPLTTHLWWLPWLGLATWARIIRAVLGWKASWEGSHYLWGFHMCGLLWGLSPNHW